jgi:hypothetical protein
MFGTPSNLAFWTGVGAYWNRHRIRLGGGFSIYPRLGGSDMSTDNVRPGVNLLSAFTLTVGAAFGIGLPMALAIIWICS